MTDTPHQQHRAHLKDVNQMVVGAGALALPVAMSEDTWDIAKNLQPVNVIAMILVAILLIGSFVYASYFHGQFRQHRRLFVRRVLIIYGLTLVVSSISLTLVDQAQWLNDFYLAFKQTVVVALPASFAATIVDNLS
jgi:uncharacterized membrane protein